MDAQSSAVGRELAPGTLAPMQTPKVMFISTFHWPTVARLPIALAKLGLHVATVAPAGSFVERIKRIRDRYIYRRWRSSGSILSAIGAWSPDLLVCSDDRALRQLHRIYGQASRQRHVPKFCRIAELIEASLGDPASFATTRTMSAFVSTAQAAQVRCPRTIVIANNEEYESALGRIVYPVLLKADGSEGGRGVRFVGSEHDMMSAICELLLPIYWPRTIKRLLSSKLLFRLFGRFCWPRRICIQEYIVGRAANRAVFCDHGTVLAGLSVEAVETAGEFGPASVVRPTDHPEMKAAAEIMARQLRLSGFLGFDFIVDRYDRAWLLEMNPRATPIAHLNVGHANLPAIVFHRLTGREPTSDGPVLREKTIALFPQELMRTGCSEYIAAGYPDVPWDEPEFVRNCVTSALKHRRSERYKKLGAGRVVTTKRTQPAPFERSGHAHAVNRPEI